MEFSYNNVLEIDVGERGKGGGSTQQSKMNANMDPETQRANLEVMLKQVLAG